MSVCKNCGGPMLALFTSEVCRNECDKNKTQVAALNLNSLFERFPTLLMFEQWGVSTCSMGNPMAIINNVFDSSGKKTADNWINLSCGMMAACREGYPIDHIVDYIQCSGIVVLWQGTLTGNRLHGWSFKI